MDTEELRNNYSLELNDLYNWFKWYDTQIMQYNRDIRVYQESNINLSQLDELAIEKANRIKEVKNLIQSTYREDWKMSSLLL